MSAVVLAGERKPDSELLSYTGARCKALIEVGRVPMLLHVVNTLGQAGRVDKILLSGPHRAHLNGQPHLNALIDTGKILWREPGRTPSTSAYQIMQTLARDTPVLVTTADLPLLSIDIVDSFCAQSLAQDTDVTVGLTPYELVRQAFPEMKKTVLRFRKNHYCSCNLFAFTTQRGRRAANFWQQVENERKKPLRVISLLGWRAIIAYLLGSLSLESAVAILSQRLDLRISVVILPYAHAAVDVDSVSDYLLINQAMNQTTAGKRSG